VNLDNSVLNEEPEIPMHRKDVFNDHDLETENANDENHINSA